jgi:hypothetical protein
MCCCYLVSQANAEADNLTQSALLKIIMKRLDDIYEKVEQLTDSRKASSTAVQSHGQTSSHETSSDGVVSEGEMLKGIVKIFCDSKGNAKVSRDCNC